jgi:cobalt/nickel transport system permease protein
MHVPDSAVSPATSAVFGVAMTPVWYAAGQRLRATLASRRVPLLALGAAYSFTLMMFNLPVPGGTTAHTTGAVLLAIALGPWAASLALTVTLVIQALFFADGGLLAVGLNCFTMAFAMPFAGWAVYRAASAGAGSASPRRAFAAGLGAWVGLNVAALLTALALGVQPLLYRGADGRALYFPFGLAVTLPAMLLPHLTVAGFAEALFTVLALRALQAARIPLADAHVAAAPRAPARLDWVLAGLGALIALTPLGLLAGGSAWGEWSLPELAARAGYLPRALAAAAASPAAGLHPLAGYLAGRGPLAYALAGLAGVTVVALLALALGRLVARRGAGSTPGAPEDAPAPSAPRPPVAFGTLPAWMRSEDAPADERRVEPRRPRRRRDLAARTLADLSASLHALLVTERLARRDGLLQRLDPRVKLVMLPLFVTLACLQRGFAPVLALLATAAVLGVLSRLPARALGRVALAVGLFAGTVTLPAALGIVTPGRPLLTLWRAPPIAVTGPGLALVAFFALRAAAAALFGALLALTTPWSELLRGLRALRAPPLFLDVLGMTWRYFALLLRSAAEMFTARRSRAVGVAPPALERRFLGGGAAALFGRTLAFAEEVHDAMRARGGAPAEGGSGEARTLAPLRLGAADAAWLGVMGALAAAVALWGRLGAAR